MVFQAYHFLARIGKLVLKPGIKVQSAGSIAVDYRFFIADK